MAWRPRAESSTWAYLRPNAKESAPTTMTGPLMYKHFGKTINDVQKQVYTACKEGGVARLLRRLIANAKNGQTLPFVS